MRYPFPLDRHICVNLFVIIIEVLSAQGPNLNLLIQSWDNGCYIYQWVIGNLSVARISEHHICGIVYYWQVKLSQLENKGCIAQPVMIQRLVHECTPRSGIHASFMNARLVQEYTPHPIIPHIESDM